jgi:hypothetical protein
MLRSIELDDFQVREYRFRIEIMSSWADSNGI